MKIERHPAVIEEDLPGIYAHIARDNPAAAERMLDSVEATFDEIAAQPGCGVIYPTRIPAMSGVRMLPVSGFGNYLIFYRVEDEVVARALSRAWRATPAASVPTRTANVICCA